MTTSISVARFIEIANQKFYSPNEWYELTGEVSNHKLTSQYHYYDLKDASDPDVSARIRIEKSDMPTDKENPLKDRKVSAIGWINMNLKTASVYLKVKSGGIVDLGESTYCKKLKSLKAEYGKDFQLPEVQDEYPNLAPDFKNIGLIYGKYSKAYDDFMAVIRKCPAIHVQKHPTAIKNIKSITRIIHDLNANKNCDCICIIRGGGSDENMRLYSTPTLLDAMRDSKLPIITGIGHAKDTPLCQNFARYPATTPTAAAYFFLQVADRYKELRKLESSCPQIPNLKKLNPSIYEARFRELDCMPHKTLEQEREMASLRELLKELQRR